MNFESKLPFVDFFLYLERKLDIFEYQKEKTHIYAYIYYVTRLEIFNCTFIINHKIFVLKEWEEIEQENFINL